MEHLRGLCKDVHCDKDYPEASQRNHSRLAKDFRRARRSEIAKGVNALLVVSFVGGSAEKRNIIPSPLEF
jgi:hypothetical protein